MDLTSQQALPVSQQIAWEALNDTAMLQVAIPGCESITPTEANQFDLAIMAAVGPVKARFKGKLRLEELQPPTSYKIYFEGQGGAAGHGKGNATVRLEPNGPNETVLHYTAHATVGGKIAQIGSRLVDMAAQKMATEFFENFTQALREKYAPAAGVPAPAEPSKGIFARFIAWLKRLVGAPS